MQNKVKSTNIYQMNTNSMLCFILSMNMKKNSSGKHVIGFIHIKLIKSSVYNQEM